MAQINANSKVQVRLAQSLIDSPFISTVFPSHQHFLCGFILLLVSHN